MPKTLDRKNLWTTPAAVQICVALATLMFSSITPALSAESSPKPDADSATAQTHAPAATPDNNTATTAAEVAARTAKTPSKAQEKLSSDLRSSCERHFPSPMQGDVRAACQSASIDFERLGNSIAETRCRLTYGEEPRLVMACLIGGNVAGDLLAEREDYKKKLTLCTETYPMHNEIDTFLHESCLTGIHIPDVVTPGRSLDAATDRIATCATITPERLFLGACAVGLSLRADESTSVLPAQQTAACEQYFNLQRYHTGYRACMGARSLAPLFQGAPSMPQGQYLNAIHGCSNISSEAGSDTERAACFVGLSIFRRLGRKEDVAARFQKCGSNKVTYQDRDFLACLAAASLLDFTDKSGAEAGCKEIFKELKSHGRGDCAASLQLF